MKSPLIIPQRNSNSNIIHIFFINIQSLSSLNYNMSQFLIILPNLIFEFLLRYPTAIGQNCCHCFCIMNNPFIYHI
jgi:hypothetical protein